MSTIKIWKATFENHTQFFQSESRELAVDHAEKLERDYWSHGELHDIKFMQHGTPDLLDEMQAQADQEAWQQS
jgi:hypothetical protein